MEIDSALKILGNSLNLANTKGAFSLQESATVFAAFMVVSTALSPKTKIETPEGVTTAPETI